jgi:hypothetical protein
MFLYGNWLKLPLDTRAKIAAHYGFTKAGPTHVQDNRVVSDGYKIEDIERCLTLDAVKALTKSTSDDWEYQWTMFVERIQNPITSEPVENEKDKKGSKK